MIWRVFLLELYILLIAPFIFAPFAGLKLLLVGMSKENRLMVGAGATLIGMGLLVGCLLISGQSPPYCVSEEVVRTDASKWWLGMGLFCIWLPAAFLSKEVLWPKED